MPQYPQRVPLGLPRFPDVKPGEIRVEDKRPQGVLEQAAMVWDDFLNHSAAWASGQKYEDVYQAFLKDKYERPMRRELDAASDARDVAANALVKGYGPHHAPIVHDTSADTMFGPRPGPRAELHFEAPRLDDYYPLPPFAHGGLVPDKQKWRIKRDEWQDAQARKK